MFQKIKSFLFKNTSTKQTVAKNTIWLTISNFGGRIVKAVIVIYGARVLGTAGWGVFSYAVTLAAFFSLLMDPGINAILMRDMAKAPKDEQLSIFSTTLIIKLCLLAIGIGIVLFAAPWFTILPGAKILLPIAALILACDTFREFFTSFLRAQEKMEWEAGIFITTNIAIVVFGFIFLSHAVNPESFGWGYVAGSALGAAMAIFILRRNFRSVFSKFSKRLVLPIMRSAWPFAVTGALGLLLTSSDILIISWMRSASEVGIYSAAIRVIQVLYLVPAILQYTTLPLFSRLANHDNPKFRIALERTISFIFLASVPLVLGGAILGTQLMTLIFGAAYATGGLAFKILMVGIIVDYPATLICTAIFAYDRQKSLIITSAIAGISNVVLDLILIPHYGIVGSSIATLIAQVLTNWYLWHIMKKINYFSVIPELKRVALAGVLMGVSALTLMTLGVNVVANIVVSGAIYFVLLLAFREPLLKEIGAVLPGFGSTPEPPATAA